MRRLKYWGPSFFWASLIFYLSNQPGSSLPSTGIFSIPGIDSVLHFIEYGILAFFMIYAFENDCRNIRLKKRFTLILIISFSYSLLDEIHQIPIQDRYFDIKDLINNLMGISFVLCMFYYFNFRKYLIENKK